METHILPNKDAEVRLTPHIARPQKLGASSTIGKRFLLPFPKKEKADFLDRDQAQHNLL